MPAYQASSDRSGCIAQFCLTLRNSAALANLKDRFQACEQFPLQMAMFKMHTALCTRPTWMMNLLRVNREILESLKD